jgi:hypothetical protein
MDLLQSKVDFYCTYYFFFFFPRMSNKFYDLLLMYSRVKNKLLPRIRTFREKRFSCCVYLEFSKVILNA